jgi:hypothetical protein
VQAVNAENTAGKQRGRPFAKGASGNPKGKPTGARHRITILGEQLLQDEAEAITRAVIEAAKAGDPTAMRLTFERLMPVRKGRPIEFALPPVTSAADVTAALASVVAQMASGAISPEEAGQIAGVLETKRKALETLALETRLAEIEAKLEGLKR